MLNKLKSIRNNEDGFTLIELLIVIVIIGILAAIAIPIFLNQQKAAVGATVKSDVRNTVSNVALWEVKHNGAVDFTTNADPVLLVETGTNTVVVAAGADQLGYPGSYTVTGSATGDTGTYVFNSSTGLYANTLG